MSSSSHGFLDSVRQLGDNLLHTVHDRLELFSLELQEEKLRIIRMLILAISAIFCGFLALIFISLTIVYLFWDTARIYVLGAFAFVYIAAFLAFIFGMKRMAARIAAPFEATRQEIAKDRAALSGK